MVKSNDDLTEVEVDDLEFEALVREFVALVLLYIIISKISNVYCKKIAEEDVSRNAHKMCCFIYIYIYNTSFFQPMESVNYNRHQFSVIFPLNIHFLVES